MNYQTATDAEINLAVAKKVIGEVPADNEFDKFFDDIHIRSVESGDVDYCNNPADMMPVVFENRIGLTFETYTNEWWATTNDFSGPRFKHINPLRAAAIVYLMMEE